MESEMEMMMRNEPGQSSAALSVTSSSETEDEINNESESKAEDSSCVNCCQTVSAKSGSSSVDLTLDSVKISSSLSTIYNLHYLTAFENSPVKSTTATSSFSSSSWNWNAKLCDECSTVFTSLWDLYENFNQLRNLESCLAKEIQKLDDCIRTQEIITRIKGEPVMEKDEEDQVHNFNDDDDPLASNYCDGYEEEPIGSKNNNVTSSGPWIILQKLENDPIAQNSIANLSSKRKASFKKSNFQATKVSPRKSRRVEGQSNTVTHQISSSEEEANDIECSEESEDSESDSNSDETDSTNSKSKVAAAGKAAGKQVSFSSAKRRSPKHGKYKICRTRHNVDSKQSADNSSQDRDNNVVAKTKLTSRHKIIKDPEVEENIYEYGGQWRYERKLDDDGKYRLYCLSCSQKFMHRTKIVRHIQQKHIKVRKVKKPQVKKRQHTKDPKVGDEIYEHAGKWRYERKRDEHGKLRLYCLSCTHKTDHWYMMVRHINNWHNTETQLKNSRLRTIQLDDNNYICDDKWRIERVTEPTGIFYKCVTCGHHKKTIQTLKEHIKTVHIDAGQSWVCEQCGKVFNSKHNLQNHIKHTHTDVKKFICEQCGHKAKTQAQLKAHAESHLGKAFVCETCGNKFTYKRSLELHRKMYSHFAPPKVQPAPETSFHVPKQCPTCKREFALDKVFEKHVASCRAKEKVPCDWCGKPILPVYLAEHKQRSCPKRSEFSKQSENGGKNKEQS